MTRLLMADRAQVELDEAVCQYRLVSERVAEEFLAELAGAFQRIADAPLWWPSFDKHHRFFTLRRHSYVIYYRVQSRTAALIVAIAHAARRPGYWRGR